MLSDGFMPWNACSTPDKNRKVRSTFVMLAGEIVDVSKVRGYGRFRDGTMVWMNQESRDISPVS